ncbi:hypothetical protein PR003_g32336 [Phytophthora rubi]|uniref:Uncharacterized protein n=1 Tax=Phytophthora rubi TaxID=129364 RepID=A0A6A4B0F6_9STRA|nr:hypothetical protein PR003_g32336 [Phytophthora rubi]
MDSHSSHGLTIGEISNSRSFPIFSSMDDLPAQLDNMDGSNASSSSIFSSMPTLAGGHGQRGE